MSKNKITAETLRTKKLTMSTLKSFINNVDELFLQIKSSFSGMTDCVERVESNFCIVSKADAIGHGGVWCVGDSRDRLNFVENETMFGIEVYNCCGTGILWTKKIA
jgi:hypothetical protein